MRTNRQAVRTLTGHTGTVRCLQFDQHKVVSGSNDCTIRVWDIHTGDCVGTLSGCGTDVPSSCAHGRLADRSRALAARSGVRPGRHSGAVRCLHMVDATLVSGSYDTTLKVWDLDTRSEVRTLRHHTAAVLCVHVVGDRVVSGTGRGGRVAVTMLRLTP